MTRNPHRTGAAATRRPWWAATAHLLLPACVTVLVLAGCSSKTDSTPTFTVHATDFSFQVSRQTVPAGKVHVVLINDSKAYEHEVWVYPQSQPRLQELLAQKQAGQDVEEEKVLQGIAGDAEDVKPGKKAEFDVTLQPGTYELACFVTSDIAGQKHVHYSDGMHALLTVQ